MVRIIIARLELHPLYDGPNDPPGRLTCANAGVLVPFIQAVAVS